MLTGAYVDRHGKVMTDGKARFLLVVQITTLERLIRNGMLLQFMLGRI